MPCFYPIEAWKRVGVDSNGKKSLHFKYQSSCGERITIACGRCIGCKLERSRQWAIRCVHEDQMHEESSFITLTYNQKYLPHGNNLKHDDFQKFLKRFRKAIQPIKIRYFMCGEYGEQCKICRRNKKDCYRSNCKKWEPGPGRPHYHAIIFGYDFKDKEQYATNKQGDKLYTSKELQKYWSIDGDPVGFVAIGEVTFESTAYVARYITKKINGDPALDHYRYIDSNTGIYIDRSPEYVSMSRGGSSAKNNQGGIGKPWYNKFKTDLQKDFITMRGIKMQPPQFYDNCLDQEDPYALELKKEKRADKARKMKKEDQTTNRLRVREHLVRKKIRSLERLL